MTITEHDFTPPALADDPIPRDRWSRPLVTPPQGGKPTAYTRCTTFVGVLEDTYLLSKWQQRMVATGLQHRPDYVLEIAGIGDPGTDKKKKQQLNAVCEKAIEAAKAGAAATIGTALHALTERLDRGQDIGVIPNAYQADIDAYTAATAGMRHKWIEQFCVQDPLKVGGTPDRISLLPGEKKPRILDLKTGSIEYGAAKIAMQLAMYARSITYDHTTGERHVHDADLDWGLVIHLPAGKGTCDLYKVDLKEGWNGVVHARDVRKWRALKFTDLMDPYNPTPPVKPVDRSAQLDTIGVAITMATTVDALIGVWTQHQANWTDQHTAQAAARRAELTAA